ncbi:hypothetical protein Ancab_033302 [Ancistrocladus abbreviatus]
MVVRGIETNQSTLSGVLLGCSNLFSLSLDEQIHQFLLQIFILSRGNCWDFVAGLCCRCGVLDDVWKLSLGMSRKDMVAWNPMIFGSRVEVARRCLIVLPSSSITNDAVNAREKSTNNRTSSDNRHYNHNHNYDGSSVNQLPSYNPNSHAAKRERSSLRFAENAVHVIPLVLVLCAIILWFCSNSGSVDMVEKSESVAATVEGLKVVSAVEVDGTQNSFLDDLELKDLDMAGHTIARKPSG